MSQTRVAMLGGIGFVGRSLSTIFKHSGDWNVSIVDQRDGALKCDVRDYDGLLDLLRGNDWVINLAAEHQDNIRPTSRYYSVNVDGARNVCNVCRDLGIQQQVFISSVAVYGDTNGTAATEDTPHRPTNDYGKSKSQAEEIYQSWWREAPTRTLIIIRPTVIFGEGNRGNLYNLMHSIATNRFRMVGDGQVVKAIAYVENVSYFIFHVVQQSRPGIHVFNYADKPDMTTAQIVSTIREGLGIDDQPLPTLPYSIAVLGGTLCDIISRITPAKLPVSAQRVRKFCTASPIEAIRAVESGFHAPVPIVDALRRTVQAEFHKR